MAILAQWYLSFSDFDTWTHIHTPKLTNRARSPKSILQQLEIEMGRVRGIKRVEGIYHISTLEVTDKEYFAGRCRYQGLLLRDPTLSYIMER